MKKWFKFYGQEFLSDPKVVALSAVERSIWLTILCLASSSSEEGTIRYVTEEKLLMLSGISPLNDEWKESEGILKKFKSLNMIEEDMVEDTIIVKNFVKRQEKDLTNAERQARFRKKHNESNTDSNGGRVTKVTLEENRIEKNRTKKESIKKESSLSFLQNLPAEDVKSFHETYEVDASKVKETAQKIVLYCESKGKVYKNYRSTLQGWLLKDFGYRRTPIKQKMVSEFDETTQTYKLMPAS